MTLWVSSTGISNDEAHGPGNRAFSNTRHHRTFYPALLSPREGPSPQYTIDAESGRLTGCVNTYSIYTLHIGGDIAETLSRFSLLLAFS
jgi:hypothetical protein